ncbi:LOW QUALITY PROTEIN: centrosomal protein of 128 kDa, partial [Neosynchiropus ocellatus]
LFSYRCRQADEKIISDERTQRQKMKSGSGRERCRRSRFSDLSSHSDLAWTMDTSSESESCGLRREHRLDSRETQRRQKDGSRAGGSSGDGPGADISVKMNTLVSTLQDTSRDLSKVDQMLGQYRDRTDHQAQAMAKLQEDLKESISHLRAQRVTRPDGAHTASPSSLHNSDLDGGSGSDGKRFLPTSPLRDYATSPGRRRRSHSAGVRFKNSSLPEEDIHMLHRSLRDLQCDQKRLAVDLDREILRRNRSEIDTRRAMENLTGFMTSSHQGSVSTQVERRLQELERERSTDRQWQPESHSASSDELQASGRHVRKEEEAEASRLQQAERLKSKMEEELERAQRLLEQSEDSRESLVLQVKEMRDELLRARKEKAELQSIPVDTPRQPAQLHSNGTGWEEGRTAPRRPDYSDLEKEVAELRVQLCKASVQSEVEDLKRALDRKEMERSKLSLQVEELSSNLARTEQQQLRMLEQLKDIQCRVEAERREKETLLQQSTSSRDELKTRAQEAIHRWRAKCKRLQKELDEWREQAQSQAGGALSAAKEKEISQAQSKALSQQAEAARRELAEILGRLAQREEELHRKDVELSKTCQRQLSLEQEIREVKATSDALQEENLRLSDVQARLREENQRLELRLDAQVQNSQKDRNSQAELQLDLKRMTSAHGQLVQQLAEEERNTKKLQQSTVDLQTKLTVAQEERSALAAQLQLQKEVHMKEMDNMKAVAEESQTKRDHEVQEQLRSCSQERDEIQTQIKKVKTDAAADKEMCEVLRIKLDRIKDECHKMTLQLRAKEESHSLIQQKYKLLKEELDDKIKSDEQRRVTKLELVNLGEKISRMETEQESILTSVGEELDAACRSLAKNGEDKIQAILQKPGLVKDAHRWFAETKSKLHWLCEEVRERDRAEKRLMRQHRQTRDHLRALKQSQDTDKSALLQRLEQQEKLLDSLNAEKKGLLERIRQKDQDMRSLQDHVLDLEKNTRIALDYLEKIPEKQCLMDDFKDLEEFQRQKELVELRFTKNKEKVWDLQHQIEECKRRVQDCIDEKLDVTSRSLRLAAFSSSIKGGSSLQRSSLHLDSLSHRQLQTGLDLDDSADSGARRFPD